MRGLTDTGVAGLESAASGDGIGMRAVALRCAVAGSRCTCKSEARATDEASLGHLFRPIHLSVLYQYG